MGGGRGRGVGGEVGGAGVGVLRVGEAWWGGGGGVREGVGRRGGGGEGIWRGGGEIGVVRVGEEWVGRDLIS